MVAIAFDRIKSRCADVRACEGAKPPLACSTGQMAVKHDMLCADCAAIIDALKRCMYPLPKTAAGACTACLDDAMDAQVDEVR